MATTRPVLIGLLIASLLGTASPALAYNESSARRDCDDKIVHWGNEYSDARYDDVQDTGWDSYDLNGRVRANRDGKDHAFTCKVRYREVVSWNVNQDALGGKDDSHKKRDRALAIGAGVVGLVALAAMMSGNKNGDKANEKPSDSELAQNQKRESYAAGTGGNPLSDTQYLRQECSQVLQRHLDDDHGAVKSLSLFSTNLNGRNLTGDGQVIFVQGGSRNLTYSCNFDRTGRIYDGFYNYRR
ncbi:hypothetical protein [Chitinibacter sp. ZOR0017]|uniref:hypothetical protein n=1 Tax=Chitinibacter sp. ZOR0017 TaxID=1339254 RepID=UPI0006464B89|nr:hypothetical protein [Chitinibacter sp. ZOR0017]